MNTPNKTPRPTEWHRQQKGYKGQCSICGCPGRYLGEHRRIPQSENANHVWEKRRKSATGWQYYPIGSRREMEIQAAEEELDRLPRNSLAAYFYGTFLPERIHRWSPYTKQKVQQAVVKFKEFHGGIDVPLQSVDKDTIERFRQWLGDNGFAPETIRKCGIYIQAIVRSSQPLCSRKMDVEGSLFAFTKRTYIPEKMTKVKENSRECVLSAIRRFVHYVGHNVMLTELSDELLSKYMQSLLEQGYTRNTINNYRQVITSVWRFANEMKLVQQLPTVEKIGPGLQPSSDSASDDLGLMIALCTEGMHRRNGAGDEGQLFRRNSLVIYFYRKYLPARAARWSRHTADKYRRAVAKFVEFRGRYDVSLESIDTGATDRFREWLLERGTGSEAARHFATYIRAIARDVCPVEEPAKTTARPAVDLDSPYDVEGSLFAFAKRAYIPEKMVGKVKLSKAHLLITVRSLCRHLGRNVMLSDLSDELVSGYMQAMLEQGYARPTINNNRADILCLWRYAHKKKLVDHWPTVEKIEVYHRIPTAWTMEEMSRILAACAVTPGYVGSIPASQFWSALVLFLFDTGCRLRATMQVIQSDFDPATGWVIVPAEIQKQKTEQRMQVSIQTIDAIKAIWKPTRLRLFEWPEKKAPWPPLKAILKRAGLPHTKKDLYHKFRRTTASHIAAAAGIDAAARQLGHSGADVTKRYIDPRIARSHVDGSAYLPRPVTPRALRGGNEAGQNSVAKLCLPAPEK